jgi:hypothetical protein
MTKIKALKYGMKTGRTDLSSYPLAPISLNPYYILGFVEGDGCFAYKGQ